MSVKLIAIGNILMKDDGIGIEVAKQLEEELIEMGINVIYGETDFGYLISKVEENDIMYIIDASYYGKKPGIITVMPLRNYAKTNSGYTQHSFSFFNLLQLYYPNMHGKIFAIEIQEVDLEFGLSIILKDNLKDISKEILHCIKKDLQERSFDYL